MMLPFLVRLSEVLQTGSQIWGTDGFCLTHMVFTQVFNLNMFRQRALSSLAQLPALPVVLRTTRWFPLIYVTSMVPLGI